SVAGGFVLASIRRVLGPTGLARVGRRGLLALGAAVVAGAAGIVTSKWIGGALDNSASSAVIAGIGDALLGCAVFAVIVFVADRSFVGEIRRLLADRNDTSAEQPPPLTTGPGGDVAARDDAQTQSPDAQAQSPDDETTRDDSEDES